MADDANFLEWGFKGLVTAIGTIGGYMWAGTVRELRGTQKELSEHKTYVAENYIKKDIVERVHDRIDTMNENISDIKTLIINMQNGKK